MASARLHPNSRSGRAGPSSAKRQTAEDSGARDQTAIDQLVESISRRNAVLFVGAGVSLAVGLPSWQALIEHMAEELGLDPGRLAEPLLTYPILAEYYLLRQGSIGPLRSWMDRKWSVPVESVARSELHQLIVELDFPIIYTTNYD